MYRLTRILPNGTVKQHSPMGTKREVETAAAYALLDNARVPRGEARAFAHRLVEQPLGTALRHDASGYIFRVGRV